MFTALTSVRYCNKHKAFLSNLRSLFSADSILCQLLRFTSVHPCRDRHHFKLYKDFFYNFDLNFVNMVIVFLLLPFLLLFSAHCSLYPNSPRTLTHFHLPPPFFSYPSLSSFSCSLLLLFSLVVSSVPPFFRY